MTGEPQAQRAQNAQEAQDGLIALAQAGDARAMEQLLAPHMPLLASLARRFTGSVLSTPELMQAGYIGLMEAVRRYDANRGAHFITYAVPWVLGEMKRALREAMHTAVSLDGNADGEEGASLLETLRGAEGVSIETIDLRMALAQLTQEEQGVLVQRFFCDKTQTQAAQVLGKSQAQVCRIERRALDRLRKLLA